MPKRVKGNGNSFAFLRDFVTFEGDDCIIWPFSRVRGYGVLGHLGEHHYAHRLMCAMAHGPAPTPKHQAAHSCGNGHNGCVNPHHLSWKTNQENQRDRRKHGTHTGAKGNRARLTNAQVAEIRRLKGVETQDSIAARMGIARGCVQYWQSTTHEPVPPGMSYCAVRRRMKKIAARAA